MKKWKPSRFLELLEQTTISASCPSCRSCRLYLVFRVGNLARKSSDAIGKT